MELHVGARLAHFEILGLLGAGGMGEVYRALDTKLKREVAIKVLPPTFAEQSDRLARFEQEAVLLASLNHPHVAAIYGVEHVDGVPCLVLELVEGPTLADRLLTGPIPVPEAIKIAGQIADALEAAHEKGIVHRDLKPANVKLTTDGKVKVLDFGLAKAFSAERSAAVGGTAMTEPRGHTAAGVVMGTASYMSPEQAEGRPVDKRTDVWSFGVLLYEMLTGKRLFDGKSDAHVLVHVMEQEPDWSKLPPLPNGVQALMERCVQKDPALRLRDIGDVRILLQASATHPMRPAEVSAKRADAPRRWLWPAATAAAILAAIVIVVIERPRPAAVAPAEAVRFDIARGEGQSSPYISISPDGRYLAFVATRADSTPQLWIRTLATQEARPLEAANGFQGVPFWSADSRYIVFGQQGKLRKADVAGGPGQLLANDLSVVVGGFASQDRIMYADAIAGAMEVPSSGGTPTPVPITASRDGKGVFGPQLLPDGQILFCECNGPGERGVYVATPGAGTPRKILPDQTIAIYARSPDPGLGYLLFVRGGNGLGDAGTLMAQPVQPRPFRLMGNPVAIAEKVRGFSASDTGVLVYSIDSTVIPLGIPGTLAGQLTWFARDGHVLSTVGDPGVYRILALSPDEQTVALERVDPETQNFDIYLFEFARGVSNRFTFDPDRDVSPIWSADGESVIFARLKGGATAEWYRRASNMAGEEELLYRGDSSGSRGVPSALSPNGRFLLVTGPLPGPADILALDLSRVAEAREAIPVVSTQFNEANARFSPNGRWFAYASNESGIYEIYVRPFNQDAKPGAPLSEGGRVMVSKGATAGGAIWRADGKELFYRAPDGTVTAVAVETEPTFRVVSSPQPLFKVPTNILFFDVSRDGQRFLMPVPLSAAASAPPYKVVLNWTSTLK